jgi:hypothetical protein
MIAPIAIDSRARRAWPFLPVVSQAGRVHQGPTGELVIVREDGGADEVLPGGHPRGGAAYDPTSTRRAA